MRLTRIYSTLVQFPVERAVALPLAGQPLRPASQPALLVQLETDVGARGIGFGQISAGPRSLLVAVEEELAPLLIGESALHHERLWPKVQALDSPAAQRAYAAVDIALWDLKGKAAGLPLWRLLGGVRESAKAFSAEPAAAHLSADEAIA